MPEEPTGWWCPDCLQGKHHACVGQAWDREKDEPTDCSCPDEEHKLLTKE